MTEAEWETSADPQAMLAFVEGRASGRKLRLVASGCCRLLSNYATDSRRWGVLGVVERHADGLADDQELTAAFLEQELMGAPEIPCAGIAPNDPWRRDVAFRDVARGSPHDAARGLVSLAPEVLATVEAHMTLPGGDEHYRLIYLEERKRRDAEVARLLRCVFGNPYRPAVADPAWLAHADGLVAKVTESIYQRRAFDELSLLADALEDSGCTDEQLLRHCRGPGPHARGCFVVDLVTGRK